MSPAALLGGGEPLGVLRCSRSANGRRPGRWFRRRSRDGPRRRLRGCSRRRVYDAVSGVVRPGPSVTEVEFATMSWAHWWNYQ